MVFRVYFTFVAVAVILLSFLSVLVSLLLGAIFPTLSVPKCQFPPGFLPFLSPHTEFFVGDIILITTSAATSYADGC